MKSILIFVLAFVLLAAMACKASNDNGASECVEYNNPPGAIGTTGTWSIQANIKNKHCVPIHVAGMRGINPNNNTQVSLANGVYARVKQAFVNMLFNAASAGATAQDCAEVVVYVIDMVSIRPIVNQVQTELWGSPTANNPFPYPPRTILQLSGFNGLTCQYATEPKYRQGTAGANGQVVCADNGTPIGDILEVKGTFYVRD
jgi:enamine deaminase RidA (YjgF/YER057c/UK114 family)